AGPRRRGARPGRAGRGGGPSGARRWRTWVETSGPVRTYCPEFAGASRATSAQNLRTDPLALAGHRDTDDPVVVARRRAPAVAVARRHPQRAVRGAHDRAQPAEPAVEQGLRRAGARAVERDAPQPLAAQRADVERAAGDRRAARRRLRRRPGHERVRIAAAVRAAPALDPRPAVVAPGADEVDLVEAVLAELDLPQPPGAVPREALDVAVADRPHRRAAERVVVRDPAVGSQAADLAV